MSDNIFTILEETIAENFKIKKDNNNLLKIEELKNNTIGQGVIIKTSRKLFAFSLDKDGIKVFPFFNNTNVFNINTKNDAIIIYEKENKIYCFIIELKSGSNGKYLKQINAGINFCNFLLETINTFYDKSFNFNYRGILFSTRNNKGTTKIKAKFENINDLFITYQKNDEEYNIEYFTD